MSTRRAAWRPIAWAATTVLLVGGGVWLAEGGTASAGTDAADAAPRATPGGADDDAAGEVVVLAAASLAEPYETLAAELERRHPGLTVTISTGPSTALAAQVAAGAPADVLATASVETMAAATGALDEAGTGTPEPVVVATNTMALAVPGPSAPGNGDAPDDDDAVRSLADLAHARYAVCRPEVPCGEGADAVLAAAGVARAPVTYENDVGGVLTKVAMGEVDAGLVYASDVHPSAPLVRAGRVVGVPLDGATGDRGAAGEPGTALTGDGAAPWTTSYPVLVLPDAPHPAGARAFVDLLTSDVGRAVLRDAGFGPPP
ncbi:molybdate ABC transporter substrate-binding protein [Actinotalea sp. JY-7876]|uniref:molybdate ABC transporter substrate-binding protein n=1 Tax=Actinotalea sp. JY-7876 TaxID=2758442 RepID=UPI0021057D42|nr:molybdate ABC transporter substrate-binding protein [Actinotalea sp. JY-7876]